MENDYKINSILHIAKADFLQRIRSYYFLIALGVCVFIIYSFVPPVNAGYTMVSLGNYRGFYNSAWIGSMVAMCVPFFALIGFYVVNNAVKRDITTGVGQIIATTRITKVQYLTGKLFSNFAVLLVILLVIMVMTIVMFFVRAETSHLELGKLLLPLIILTIPAMFIIACLALVFDSLTDFSQGFLNIAYFFVWIFMVSGSLWSPATDVFGGNTCMIDIKNGITATHPDWNGKSGRCNDYIFSAAYPLKRQLPATLLTAAFILLCLAMPVMVRVLISGNFYSAYAILVGALFVPAFAVASGILTGGSKLFEVVFTMMVYAILNRVPFCDFIGAIEKSHEQGLANYLLIITVVLLIAAFAGRKRQIIHSHTWQR